MKFATRRLGNTSLRVTALGLGSATLGGNMQPVTDAEARKTIGNALDAGINYVDTAPFYGFGKSEHAVGDVLRARKGWVLSSKVGRLLKPLRGPATNTYTWRNPLLFDPVFDYTYDAIMRSYEDSQQRLGLNRIDILYIHSLDVYDQGSRDNQEKAFRLAMDQSYKALDALRSAGEIKAIGLGINDAAPIADAMQHGQWDVFLLAGRYTLLEQEPLHTVFPAVKKHGASIVVGGPFNSGVLVGGKTFNYSKAPPAVVAKVKRLARICAAHKVALPAAALQFTPAHPLVASVVPGPRSAAELKQILGWWQKKIPSSLWSDLKNEGVLDQAAPTPK